MTQSTTDTKPKNKSAAAAAAAAAGVANTEPSTPAVVPGVSSNWWDQYAADSFQTLELDTPSWKPELFTARDERDPQKQVYNGLPLQGFPIAYYKFGEMKADPQTGEIKDAMGYIFLLTGPIKGIRDGEVVDMKPGDKLIVWQNAQIGQALRGGGAANHATHVAHMKITPLFKGPHPTEKTQSMWRFKFEVAPKPTERAKIPGGTDALALLMAGNTLSLTG